MNTLGFGILIVSWLSSTDSVADSEPSGEPLALANSSTGSIRKVSREFGKKGAVKFIKTACDGLIEDIPGKGLLCGRAVS